MGNESARLRLARATVLAHGAVAKATRSIMQAHQDRIEPLNALAKAYQAEADAAEDKKAAERLRLHADFALKFVSLTTNEIAALKRELERTEMDTRVAEARSRGESPTPRHLQRATVPDAQQVATDGQRSTRTRRTARSRKKE